MTSDSFFFFVAAFFKACNGYWCFSLDLEFIGHSGPTKDYAPFRCILFRKLMHLFFFFCCCCLLLRIYIVLSTTTIDLLSLLPPFLRFFLFLSKNSQDVSVEFQKEKNFVRENSIVGLSSIETAAQGTPLGRKVILLFPECPFLLFFGVKRKTILFYL